MMKLSQLMSFWRPDITRGYRVVALGSSNTELGPLNHGRFNWVSWIEVALRQQVGMHLTVTNSGIGGQTVGDLLTRVDRDISPISPDLVIITIGGNDYKQMSVEQYRKNLETLVRQLKASGTIPVLQTYYSVMMIAPEASRAFEPYMRAKRAIAASEGIACIDSYSSMYAWHCADATAYTRIMLDEVHLNAVGHAVFGTLCARTFGLADPIVPLDIEAQVSSALQSLSQYAATF